MKAPVLVQLTFALWFDSIDECVELARSLERNAMAAMEGKLAADGVSGEDLAELMRFYGVSISMAVDGWERGEIE